jgi:hypothetical protein
LLRGHELTEATNELLISSTTSGLTEMDGPSPVAPDIAQIEFLNRLYRRMVLPPISTASRSLCSRPKPVRHASDI